MHKLIFLLFVLVSFNTSGNAFSAFTEGTIILRSGEELKGLVKFGGPQAIMAKSIKYKRSSNSKSKKYNSEDVKYVVVTSMEYEMVFEYSSFYKFSKNKKTKHKTWNRLISSCNQLNVYVTNQFSFTKAGKFFIVYDERLSQNEFLFQRPGEECPSKVGSTRDNNVVGNKAQKDQTKKLSQYFEGNSEIVSLIKKNNLDVRDFEKIGEEICTAAE